MTTKLPFSEFLKTKGNLTKTSNGYEACVNQNGTYITVDYTREEIEAFSDKVACIVDELFVYVAKVQSGLPMVYAEYINATIAFWENPLKITSTTGTSHHIGSINGLMVCHDKHDEFELSVVVNDMQAETNNAFVAKTSWGTLRVSGSELDKHFPDWRVRYALLTSLNVDHAELIEGLFGKRQSYEPQPITDINFE